MKSQFNQFIQCSLVLAATLVSFSSCKKDISANPVNQSTITKSSLVPVTTPLGVALNGFANAGVDSVYVVYTGENTLLRQEISVSELPGTAQNYQQENYQNYTPMSAYTIIDADGNTKGFISVIRFNERPVVLEYAFDGVFSKVMEQREWVDLDNDGWHAGGIFDYREGSINNIDINTLPDEIKNYMANNYPNESISKALRTKEDAYIVLSNNIGANATVFNSGLSLHQHLEICSSNYQLDEVEKSSISVEAINKIANTFPNAAIEAASRMSENGLTMGNLVLINANNTHYAITFDTFGNVLSNKVIF